MSPQKHPPSTHEYPPYSLGTVYHVWTFNLSPRVGVAGTDRPEKLQYVSRAHVLDCENV